MPIKLPPEAIEPFTRAWRHRELIRAVARREFMSRFRGSALGPAWAVLAPLIMMLTYTAVFSITVPQLAAGKSVTEYASRIFVGLIIFNLFSELAYRAPMLLHEHVNFVKKSIFPSETIAWTATIRAFTYGGVAFVVFFGLSACHGRRAPGDAAIRAVAVRAIRAVHFGDRLVLHGAKAFTCYVAHIMASIVPILMFATPALYSMDQVPPHYAIWLRLNIVGDYIDMLRDVALDGVLPNPFGHVLLVAASYAVFLFGYQFFMRYKSVIVDVI